MRRRGLVRCSTFSLVGGNGDSVIFAWCRWRWRELGGRTSGTAAGSAAVSTAAVTRRAGRRRRHVIMPTTVAFVRSGLAQGFTAQCRIAELFDRGKHGEAFVSDENIQRCLIVCLNERYAERLLKVAL